MSSANDSFGVMAITGFAAKVARHDETPVVLDSSQAAVLALAEDLSAAVIGAPGSGKTTTLVELVADRLLVRGWERDSVLVLTSSRTAATRLRDVLAVRLGIPTSGPLARTINSLAFEIVGDAARAVGVPPRRLLTGGEQDADIAALLEGHAEGGTGPSWPPALGPEVRGLRQFRTELRELMMRATEFDVSTTQLREHGRVADRPEWGAAADFIDEYLQVISSAREAQVDPAELARFAVEAIRSEMSGLRVASLRLVVVDDLQEATESTLAILRALAARGTTIVAFGDPDVAANAFRGGEPDALGRLASVLGIPSLRQLVLSTSHRQGPELREFTRGITARIGAAAAGLQRRAVAGGPSASETPLSMILAVSPAREWSAIARVLREQHLERGVPWNDMAVVVRSGAAVEVIARALALAEVPTRTAVGGTALRDDHAARALLTLVDVGVGRKALDAETATELLLGPFGGLDRLGFRRLRLALRAEEVAGDGTRSADALLIEGLSGPNRFVTIDHRVGRAAGRLAETLALLREATSETGGSIQELLWTGWERSGLAKAWYDQALGAGIGAAEANRNLDGIVALFTAAKRFAERRPDAAPGVFLAEVLDADVPEDTLSPQPNDETVLVTTASGTVGLEFHTVVIAALQDGAWPNLRLRGSLLAAQELVARVTGIDPASVDERKQVLGDELRMFALAASRARRRLILAAVANDDEAPSPFFGLLPEGTPALDASAAPPLSLRGMTGRLRGIVVAGDNDRRTADAASSLAALAAEGVPGAAPAEWHGLLSLSITGPLYEGDQVPVSPSSLEKLVDSPLDWFLEMIAGGESGVVADVGTILHWAMETSVDHSGEALWTAVQSRWGELLFDAPWLAERQSRIARTLTEALAEYLGDFSRDGKLLVGAESRFVLELDDIVVRGSIDRVERAPDGSVVIVDLKTGTPVTAKSKIDEHPQLSAYQLAYADGFLDDYLAEHGIHRSGGAKLLFVKEGKDGRLYREAVQAPLTEQQLADFRHRIRLAATLIAASEFEGPQELGNFGFGDVARLRLHRVRAVSSE